MAEYSRFDLRTARAAFESSVPAIGVEANDCMKDKHKYTNEPMGRLKIMPDFLPPPDQLVLREDAVKVTLTLSSRSVDFFKAHAAREKVPYQKMIRSVLDGYVSRYQEK